jgi:hypothetical protein
VFVARKLLKRFDHNTERETALGIESRTWGKLVQIQAFAKSLRRRFPQCPPLKHLCPSFL